MVIFAKGGSFFTGDGYKDGRYEGSANSLLGNHPEIDLSKDSFYTAGTMNTPQARFNSAAQKGGYDPQWGSIICEGGDVIVQKYGKVYCEGAAGLSLRGGTLYNYGLIVQLRGSDWRNDCVIHNDGAYYLTYSVAGASLQRFRDLRVETSSGRVDFPLGETSNGRIINEECAWFTGNGCG